MITREGEREGEDVESLKERILTLQRAAHENQEAAAEKQRSFHDAHAQAHHFEK